MKNRLDGSKFWPECALKSVHDQEMGLSTVASSKRSAFQDLRTLWGENVIINWAENTLKPFINFLQAESEDDGDEVDE